MKDSTCNHCPYLDNNYVGPEGSSSARIAVIGEAPGKHEDSSGRPFVGPAGYVLEDYLKAIGLQRQDVYITNVLKCRPPKDLITTPQARQAIALCVHRLFEELSTIRPAVIVPVGATALHALGFDARIGKMRGYVLQCRWGKTIPTWHPAYYFRSPEEKVVGTYDWAKIKRHTTFSGNVLPSERFILNPTILGVEQVCQSILADANANRFPEVAIDIETYLTPHPLLTPIKLVGLATSEEDALVIPFITESGNYYWQNADEERRAVMALGDVLAHPGVVKVVMNALFDLPVLMNHGFTIAGDIFDVMLAHYLIYHPIAHDLEQIVSMYADYFPWKLLPQVGDTDYRTYNARDCVVLQMVKHGLRADLRYNKVAWVAENLMRNILPSCKMMLNGIHVDREQAKQIQGMLKVDLEVLKTDLSMLAGKPDLNPNSSPQLREILFKKMKLRSAVKTKKSKELSTGEDVLNRLSLRYPDNEFVSKMLEWRKLSKLKGTYSNPPIFEDGRVHTEATLTGVVSGRFAYRNPNIGNLPTKRGDPQGYIRKMYTAEPGNLIVEADYSQIELYIFALISGDPEWLEAFKAGVDIHELNGIALTGEYKKEHRRFYKNFVYGLIYGSEGSEIERVAPKELIERLSIRQMLENFWQRHPTMFIYRTSIESSMTQYKKVVNPFGRIRWFPGAITKAEIRSGINQPIQSTVADMMHEKMPKLDEELEWPTDRLILQLHDAFYVETSERRVQLVAEKLQRVMQEPIVAPNGLVIDNLKVGVEVGPNLIELQELKEWMRKRSA